MTKVILVINSGSSSIKFSIFNLDTLQVQFYGKAANINTAAELTINSNQDVPLFKAKLQNGYQDAFKALFKWTNSLADAFSLVAVGHRIVHGGNKFFAPTIISEQVLEQLKDFVPLAPLHQPHNLEAVKIIKSLFPDLLQIGCFDTAFHRTQTKLATLFAIPKELTQAGIIRYGFHGLSYEYITQVLPNYIEQKLQQKVIVAHLGNGASACAIEAGKSLATSMGFTALEGLMMGTRCGSVDPGVLLYLLQAKHYSITKLEQLLYEESGLLGVSGISNDMLVLENSDAPAAKEAIDLYCFKAAREIGALITILKGCDTLVFTAGIGENSALVRAGICNWLDAFNVKLEPKANQEQQTIISAQDSKVAVAVIPTNEELMVAMHIKTIL